MFNDPGDNVCRHVIVKSRFADIGYYIVHGSDGVSIEFMGPGRQHCCHLFPSLQGFLPDRCRHISWFDDGNGDVPGQQFHAQRVGESFQGKLGGAIRTRKGQGAFTGDGSHVDDAAVTFAQEGEKGLGDGDLPDYIYFELPAQFVDG